MEKIRQVDVDYISDRELYVDDDAEICPDSSDTLTFSWADIVEEELGSSLTEKVLTGSIVKEPEQVRQCDTDEILQLTIGELDDLTLLEYEVNISSSLRKAIKSYTEQVEERVGVDKWILLIEWLINSSKLLSQRVGLELYHHKSINVNEKVIPRSSYKFCNYNFECEFNYNTKKHKGCYAQHFVHNMIYADLCALKEFICLFKDHLPQDELRKSINTISFVINHMHDELKNVALYSRCSGASVHIERTPQKKEKGDEKKKHEKTEQDKQGVAKKFRRRNRRRERVKKE